MSEAAPEAPARPGGGGRAGVWSRKMGPLPAWGWAGIGLVVILIYMYMKNKNSAGASNTSAANSAAAGTGAGQIPEFVNQTYTTVTPPGEPITGPKGSTGPPGKPGGSGPFLITANGKQSLAQLAKSRNTTVAHLRAMQKSGPGFLTAQQLEAFMDYIKGGANKPMPKGLSILVSTGPGEGTTSTPPDVKEPA